MCNSTVLKASAIFVDLENIAHGEKGDHFDISQIMARVNKINPPVLRKAYGDWGQFARYRSDFTDEAFDLVQVAWGKNGVDIQMSVDALEAIFLFSHIGTIFLVTGDSDYCSLARVLRKHQRRVIGISWLESIGKAFRQHCDEFWPYDEIADTSVNGRNWINSEPVQQLILQATEDLGPGQSVRLSRLKEAMRRRDSSFDEKRHGFPKFKSFVEAHPDLVLRFSGETSEYLVTLPGGRNVSNNDRQ